MALPRPCPLHRLGCTVATDYDSGYDARHRMAGRGLAIEPRTAARKSIAIVGFPSRSLAMREEIK